MKILIITGPLHPAVGNNANLLSKLIPHLSQNNQVFILSFSTEKDVTALPKTLFGIPVFWAKVNKIGIQNFVYAHVIDRSGLGDGVTSQALFRKASELIHELAIDTVLSSSEPYSAAIAASRLSDRPYKTVFLMDPPALVLKKYQYRYRNRYLKTILHNYTQVLTTPFVAKEISKIYSRRFDSKMISVGFPMIMENAPNRKQKADAKIRLLFCGWLYSDIRSPRYFLDIVSRLDERFEVTFMGKECELLQERFPIETKAKLITMPNQPYDVALQAMADADVLINIGNSVPVHMPSKTLEYINTGKPMVNFYKLEDCPTLYYTERYPLALNLFEEEKDLDAVTERFIRFCEENNGKTVERSYIESEYADCTPQYIAQKILECLEK